MLDLSTINATTIADPATVGAIEGDIRRLEADGDAIGAATLLRYLERQLPVDPNDGVRKRFRPFLIELRRLADREADEAISQEPSLERAAFSEPRPERVAVRDETGRLRLFDGANLVDAAAPLAAPPSVDTKLPKTVGLRQSTLNRSSAQRPVPVSYETPEDEEEIRLHADRLSQFQLEDAHDIDAVIDEIVTSNGLSFSDEILAKRFRTLAAARLKDIRSSAETKELLARPPKIGGLGLSPEAVAAVLAAFDQRAQSLRESLPSVKPAAPIELRPGRTVLPPSAPMVQAPTDSVRDARREQGEPAPTPPKIPPETLRPVPPPPPRPIPPAPAPFRRPLPVRALSPTSRPVVEDVRPPSLASRLVGPLEELEASTLDDFRRWGGGDAAASVRKAYEKVVLLGQESFSQRVAGVQAWRRSPVHALYLAMSRESLEQGKDIPDVIQARLASGQPALAETEFHAIVDLNRQLRF